MRARVFLVTLILALAGCSTSGASPAPGATQEQTSPALGSPSAVPSPSDEPIPPPSAPPPVAWTELTAAGPAPREDHTWTVDPEADVAYLFGGRDGTTIHGDLWAYDLATDAWNELSPNDGPDARFGHEAAWVPGQGLVIVAGQAGATFFNDLWAYDPGGNAWRQLPATGTVPVARYGTCAALGADGRLWISHGFTSDGVRFADTLAYDFALATWSDETPVADRPVNRCLHGCWWTDDGRLLLYGGQTTGVTAIGDLWALQPGERPGTNAWLQAGGTLPPERNLYARARIDGGTLVFGGQGVDGGHLADLWRFDDASAAPQPVHPQGGSPAPRRGAELVWDTATGRALLFGGTDGETTFADVWALNLGS